MRRRTVSLRRRTGGSDDSGTSGLLCSDSDGDGDGDDNDDDGDDDGDDDDDGETK
jgi:hypothetical protein